MFGLRVHPHRLALACLLLLTLLSVGRAPAQPVSPTTGTPATLRLVQVVPRLPDIHLYAIAQDGNGKPVDVQASELSALVGSNRVSVETAKDDGIGIVFLVDISASLKKDQFDRVKSIVQAWIAHLRPEDPASSRLADRAAIVTFGERVATVQDFTDDKLALDRAVRQLPSPPHDQQTLLYQGIVQAIDISRRLDRKLPLRRAIVVLTDGLDDQQGGAGRQEVIDKLEIDPIPIYGFGASLPNNAKVDAALKDFAALVRASGGDYRRVNLVNLDSAFSELRDIVVPATRHYIAKCNNPPCPPDGSVAVVRMFMSRGAASLSSESVKARLVGTEGKPVQPEKPPPQTLTPPVTPPATPSVALPVTGSVAIPPPSFLQSVLKFILKVPPQWWIVLALMLAGVIAGIVVFVQKPRKKTLENLSMKETIEEPPIDNLLSIGVHVSKAVAIPPGTNKDKQRLRLYPIGRNDLQPQELLFEDDVPVGRTPEPGNRITIDNDGQVSGRHCTLSPKGKYILVKDDGSRNGTRVNGVPINGFMHAEPDSILGVGRTELRMKLLPVGAQ